MAWMTWLRRFISKNPETGDAYSQSYQTLRASALNVFWFWLIETGKLKDNPVALLIDEKRNNTKKPSGGKRPKRLPDVLGWNEQRLLLNTIQQLHCRTCVRDYALLLPNIDLEYRRLRIIGKGNKERTNR